MIGLWMSFVVFPYLVLGDACSAQRNCHDCITTNTFIPLKDVKCRWCPLDGKCHTFGSSEIPLLGFTKNANPCEQWMNIKEESNCSLDSDESVPYDPAKAFVLANLSAVAYADFGFIRKCMEKIVPKEEYQVVVTVSKKCDMDRLYLGRCYAFVAVSKLRKEIVILLRVRNAKLIQFWDEIKSWVKTPFGKDGAKIDRYLNTSFSNVYYPCIYDTIKDLVSQNRDYNVVVTGHALGGAIASLAAYTLVTEGIVDKKRLLLYTFGMPRVGDKAYAYYHDMYVINSWRIIHNKDKISRSPSIARGFYHHGTTVLYPEEMQSNTKFNISRDNEDPETLKGSSSLQNHLKYFGVNIPDVCKSLLGSTITNSEGIDYSWKYCGDQLDQTDKHDTCTETPIKNVTESVCDFDKDFCDWTSVPCSKFNFQRKKGPSDKDKKTGPVIDKTGSGYYIYVDASDNELKLAKLRSPNFTAGNYCIEFYYHMFGEDMGSLELYMYTTITPRKSIFKKEGEHGTTWRLQRGDVYATNLGKGLMHFEFEATIGKGYKSDIAIDSVSITKGHCHRN
ncbi:uncharacterized protein LOC127875191 [Dreissena polymorpha]|uniref:MAM domain-containing protein n=1 Tax=Dreissena polymorpha TaxID=45954 RepID=A0A9D4L705_DREPO|nr:uncharacterized protein LOC127875191 [Dreissena polymorpha]KAH3853192.1 hypothetical protein DPMN_095714 [Dreissena polymorpha]